ncbi:hypothetical protein H6A33_09030 [Collinsella tanakaei]|nr:MULTISPECIES: hypothetical protein [Collinsella]MBM6786336.1 hypothetical protein [Collinsella tanakaei]MDN0064284.1 hypothetical protein [Collinsella ihumii]OUO61575.1 hypothetical protein B5F74_05500 [Collinsella sp. An271]HJG31452.1 hypothetical protein [Collinsella ihumii]
MERKGSERRRLFRANSAFAGAGVTRIIASLCDAGGMPLAADAFMVASVLFMLYIVYVIWSGPRGEAVYGNRVGDVALSVLLLAAGALTVFDLV